MIERSVEAAFSKAADTAGTNVHTIFGKENDRKTTRARNRTITSCVVSWSHQSENISLHEGSYIIKLYNADSGVFVKQYEIYVAKNIEFIASPFQ